MPYADIPLNNFHALVGSARAPILTLADYFDSLTGTGLSIDTTGKMGGKNSMKVVFAGTSARYGVLSIPDDPQFVVASTKIKSSELSMETGNDSVFIGFINPSSTSTSYVRVAVANIVSLGLVVRIYSQTDTATVSSSYFQIADGDEIKFSVKVSNGTNNGEVRLYKNGSLLQSLSNIDNDMAQFTQLRVGAVGALEASTSGNLYLDDIWWGLTDDPTQAEVYIDFEPSPAEVALTNVRLSGTADDVTATQDFSDFVRTIEEDSGDVLATQARYLLQFGDVPPEVIGNKVTDVRLKMNSISMDSHGTPAIPPFTLEAASTVGIAEPVDQPSTDAAYDDILSALIGGGKPFTQQGETGAINKSIAKILPSGWDANPPQIVLGFDSDVENYIYEVADNDGGSTALFGGDDIVLRIYYSLPPIIEICSSHIEYDSYIAPDGSVYRFNNNIDKWVWGFQGGGLAPVEYITQQGPFQHGQTVIDYRFQPRMFTLIHRRNGSSRSDYWANRRQIIAQLTPSRQLFGQFAPGILRKKISPTVSVDLKVLVAEGLNFDQRQNGWDEWAIQDAIRFIAHDPFYYGTSTHEIEFGGTGDDELVFPITFPIVFGKSFVDDTQVITYAGTFGAYPLITIVGPAKGVTITNLATDEIISFNYTVPTGVTVVINLIEGRKTAQDNLGNNLIGAITPDSDLGTFHIAPHPEAPNGINPIRLTAAGTQPGETLITLSYRNRYVGV